MITDIEDSEKTESGIIVTKKEISTDNLKEKEKDWNV